VSSPHTQSFAVTLDAAIEDAGLGLDRLRQRLAARGVSLSGTAGPTPKAARLAPSTGESTPSHGATQGCFFVT
jgi:hypothetical protein